MVSNVILDLTIKKMPNHTNLTVISENLQFVHLSKHIYLSLHIIDIQVSATATAAAGMISSRAANTNLFKFLSIHNNLKADFRVSIVIILENLL